MNTDHANLDPHAVWKPFEPSSKHAWDRRLAAHLFRRSGFAANSRQLNEAVRGTPAEAVDSLLATCRETAPFDADMRRVAQTAVASGDVIGLEPWWLYRMLQTPAPLLEKMTLFWHGHFATSGAKVQNARLMLAQNELLRRRALDRFEPLVQAVSCDPAMLIYLDSVTNGKAHPNENYAREVMELFCLGLGKYTEKDVQEVARCFTGWEVRGNRFRFNRFQHDGRTKSFLGQTGRFEGEDAVRIILAQPAAPLFIARKLVRFFVCDEPLSDALIEPLALQLRTHDFRIEPTVRQILMSRFFFSPRSIGRRIRGPVELAVGLLRAMEGTASATALAAGLRPLGQRVFFPPSVKGWEGGRTWINANTILGRANLVRQLIDAKTTRFVGGSLAEYLDSQGLKSPGELVDWLEELLLAVPLPPHARSELIALRQRSGADPAQRAADVIHALAATPEFHLA